MPKVVRQVQTSPGSCHTLMSDSLMVPLKSFEFFSQTQEYTYSKNIPGRFKVEVSKKVIR